MKVHKYQNGWEAWYDRSWRIWVVAQFDSIGNQIGECDYTANKDDIVDLIEYHESIRNK